MIFTIACQIHHLFMDCIVENISIQFSLKMENIINNPGLQHLAENIFLNLNYANLKKCELINQSANQILNNPMLWIRKLSEENQKEWIEAIQSDTISVNKKHITAYLKWSLKKKSCYNQLGSPIVPSGILNF